MKIEYETNLDDVEAWLRHYLTIPEIVHALRKRGLSYAGRVSLLILVLSYVASKDPLVALVPAAIMFLAIWVMIGSALRHETMKRTRKAIEADPTNPALGQHTLELTPEGITEVCSHHTLSVKWDIVRSIALTTSHVFIILTNLTVFIVPSRAFPSETARDDFVGRVQELIPSPACLAGNRNV